MANELYLDPGAPGPFANLPLTSQLFVGSGSPWTSVQDWGYVAAAGSANYTRQILNPGRTMWQFGLKPTQPTAAGLTFEITEATAFPSTGAPFNFLGVAHTPVMKAVYKYNTSGTAGANQFLGNGTQFFQGSGRIQRALRGGTVWDGNFTYYPRCAYIYRPGTGSVVGWLWDLTAFSNADGYMWGHDYASIGWNSNRPTRPWYSSFRQVYVSNSPPTYITTAAKTNNSVAFQSGDYLVFELWGSMSFSGASVPTQCTLGFDVWLGGAGSTYSPGDLNPTETTSPTYGTQFRSSATVPAGELPPQGGSYPGVSQLTNVDPLPGQKIRLTFSPSVAAGSPVVGPRAGAVNVLAATQVDEATVDLDLSIRPPASGVGF